MALTKVDKSVSSTPGIVDNSDTTAITIDSSERVGLNGLTPSDYYNTADDLVLGGSSSHGITIVSGTTENGAIFFADGTSGNAEYEGYLIYEHGTNVMRFATSATERMRIDASGNLLVGQTSLNYNAVGASIASVGTFRAAVDGGLVGAFNRKTSFGPVINLYKDGASSGTIGAYTTSRMYMGSGDTGIVFYPDSDAIYPVNASTPAARGDAIDLGLLGTKFDDVYANGTVNFSDRNGKNTITDSDLGLDFVKRLSPVSYKINHGKSGRIHYGLIAQDIETVLSDINKPATDFAGFIKGDTSEEQDGSSYEYGLRYHEFIAPLIKAIQEQQEIIDDLKARIEELEA